MSRSCFERTLADLNIRGFKTWQFYRVENETRKPMSSEERKQRGKRSIASMQGVTSTRTTKVALSWILLPSGRDDLVQYASPLRTLKKVFQSSAQTLLEHRKKRINAPNRANARAGVPLASRMRTGRYGFACFSAGYAEWMNCLFPDIQAPSRQRVRHAIRNRMVRMRNTRGKCCGHAPETRGCRGVLTAEQTDLSDR